MPTTYTRKQLVERALRVLKVTEANEAPNAEDYATVDELVDAVLDQLNEREIVHVQDDDAIEPAIFLPLAECLADACTKDFGGVVDVAAAEQKLREIIATTPTYEVQKVEYF